MGLGEGKWGQAVRASGRPCPSGVLARPIKNSCHPVNVILNDFFLLLAVYRYDDLFKILKLTTSCLFS